MAYTLKAIGSSNNGAEVCVCLYGRLPQAFGIDGVKVAVRQPKLMLPLILGALGIVQRI